MFKISNELVEIPINDCLSPADKRTRGGHSRMRFHDSHLALPRLISHAKPHFLSHITFLAYLRLSFTGIFSVF